jgi:2-amino-4-hydroxy-6-hydroxymethyldihydropteridine diphosphokinase
MATVYLSLGSNLGNRAGNIYGALRRLAANIRVDEISTLYETEPVGLADQPWFLNLVCRAQTNLSPEALLTLAKTTEQDMGREKTVRFGPRVIDIDILMYDNLVLSTPRLEIPHPRLHERGFVLIPLGEVAPHLIHPVLQKSVSELRERANTLEEVRPYSLKDERASS